MTDPGPPLVVVNPRAAGGRVGRGWDRLRPRLEAALGPFDALRADGPEEATEGVRAALEGGRRWIASLGGDGTHSQVVNGFFRGAEPVAPGAALSILPAGTGGDLRRMLEGDGERDLEAFARAAREAAPTPIDVGWLSHVDDTGRPAERVFLNVASLGLGGVVDRLVNAGSKALGGTATFFLATVRGLVRYDAPRVRLVVDGAPLGDAAPVLSVAACNGGYFGGGMHVAPPARLDDGLLDLVVLPWRGVLPQLLRGTAIYRGAHLAQPGVRHLRFRELRAEADRDCYLDVDGEAPGKLPLSLRVLPGAVLLRGRLRPRRHS